MELVDERRARPPGPTVEQIMASSIVPLIEEEPTEQEAEATEAMEKNSEEVATEQTPESMEAHMETESSEDEFGAGLE